jgi:xylan 1,4-beta-xylosidase
MLITKNIPRRSGQFTCIWLLMSLGLMAGQARADAAFSHVLYQATDRTPIRPADGQIRNPILPGFYPDPSIVRVGKDYYLVNSTFAFYPGIPIFHSTDLRQWQQIGNAIDRQDMLNFAGLWSSRGVFAPDISYKNGVFYILNTCVDCGGNFLITARDPKGPWSNPVWLGFDGIDPSLFHDTDGKSYVVNNGPPIGEPLYDGHRAIWVQEFDTQAQKLIGPRQLIVNGGVDISQKPSWIEGPHLLKKDGFYYLIAAEGGTGDNHSEVVFRSSSVFGPFMPAAHNPILTQRDLKADRANPVSSAGHAKIFQTEAGDWAAVFLATRPYGPDLYNIGRETFIHPVTWKDGWPTILERNTPIPYAIDRLITPTAPIKVLRDGDRSRVTRTLDDLAHNPQEWLRLRTPKAGQADFAKVTPTQLQLTPRPEMIGDAHSSPSFIGLRQYQAEASLRASLTYSPIRDGDRAGLVALQSDDANVFCGISRINGTNQLILSRRAGAKDAPEGIILASVPAPKGTVTIDLSINQGTLGCRYKGAGAKAAWKYLQQNSDATFLSTRKAGGFVGTIMGFYAYTPQPAK